MNFLVSLSIISTCAHIWCMKCVHPYVWMIEIVCLTIPRAFYWPHQSKGPCSTDDGPNCIQGSMCIKYPFCNVFCTMKWWKGFWRHDSLILYALERLACSYIFEVGNLWPIITWNFFPFSCLGTWTHPLLLPKWGVWCLQPAASYSHGHENASWCHCCYIILNCLLLSWHCLLVAHFYCCFATPAFCNMLTSCSFLPWNRVGSYHCHAGHHLPNVSSDSPLLAPKRIPSHVLHLLLWIYRGTLLLSFPY